MLPEPTPLQQFPQTTIVVSFDTINTSIYWYSKCFLSQFYLNVFNILVKMLYISSNFFHLGVRLSDVQVPRGCLILLLNYFYQTYWFTNQQTNQIRWYLNLKNQKGQGKEGQKPCILLYYKGLIFFLMKVFSL